MDFTSLKITKDIRNLLIGGIAVIVLLIFVIPTISDNYKLKRLRKSLDQIEQSRTEWNNSLSVLRSNNAVLSYQIDSIKLTIDSIQKQQIKDILKYQKDAKKYKQKINSVSKWTNAERDLFWATEFSIKDSVIKR